MLFFCEECGERIEYTESETHDTFVNCPSCSMIIQIPEKYLQNDSSEDRGMAAPPSESEPVKVLIVDDSKVIRRIIRDILCEKEGFVIAGEASNGLEAVKMASKVSPDVITMDVVMPEMDGLTALKHIMIKEPKPVVMLSSVTKEGSRDTFNALNYGAIDFLEKPSMKKDDIEAQKQRIIEKVRIASHINTDTIRYFRKNSHEGAKKPATTNASAITAIGTAEGGYGALLKLIPTLSPGLPSAVIVVIHSEPEHVRAFCSYLDEISDLPVHFAENHMELKEGACYIAPGSEYVTISEANGSYTLHMERSPFPQRRGAVNMLMFSVAEKMQDKSLAILMTGTGEDGVEGASEIDRTGGTVMVQDLTSCLYTETVSSFLEINENCITASDMAMSEALHNHFTCLKEKNTNV